jgi:hypothetical protein
MCSVRNEASSEWRANLGMRFIESKSLETGQRSQCIQQRTKQSSGLSAWLAQLTSRMQRNVAAVALANKLARIAWADALQDKLVRTGYVVCIISADATC